MSRFRYSAWDGTQEAPDFDAEDVLRELSDELLYHGDVNQALRRLLQQGFDPRAGERVQGLADVLGQLRARRREMLRRYDPGGVLEGIRGRLQDVVDTEERAVGGGGGGPPPPPPPPPPDFLHDLPDDAGDRLRALREYDFADAEAGRKFTDLLDELRRQAVSRFSSQLSRGLANLSTGQLQRTKDMMAALNRMLAERAAGREPDFEDFMERFGDFFPENPRTLDELLEQLARRMAATQMLLSSMTDEERSELQSLLDGLLDDMDLQWQATQLGEALREAFPSLPWEKGYGFTGSDPLDLAGGMGVMDALAEMEGLEAFLGQATTPALLDEVDPEQIRRLLGDDAAESIEALRRLTKLMEEAGLVARREGRFELTPRGMRRIGQGALEDVFREMKATRFGEHTTHRRGAGGDPAYETKPYEFGDPFLLDVGRTVRNALARTGAGTPVRVGPEDFEVEQTERLTRCATVICLDLSLSMPMRDNFLAAKKVAIALHALITTRFPRDHLGIVGFSEVAHEIAPEKLPEASYDFVYGTNMQHALMLARHQLARHRVGSRQVILITDGEPTAHLEGGRPFFSYPPVRETVEATLKEVLRCTRDRIQINTFMLDESPALRRFVERMTEMNRGRAFFTTPQTLGDYVLVDFLEHRRRLRHAR